MKVLRLVGVRLTAQQAAKFVPIAGQAVSAVLTYSSLRYVCEQHIQQCVVDLAPADAAGADGGRRITLTHRRTVARRGRLVQSRPFGA